MKNTKSGFTMMEVMIIVVLIAVGLITVINSLKNSNTYLQKTKQKIVAINLAREGVEQMFNMRDTNWMRRAGKKDATRLKINPFEDTTNDGDPTNDERFQQGSYIIQTNTTGGQEYFYAQNIPQNFDISNGNSGDNLNYSLCETNGLRKACPGNLATSSQGTFFRYITGKGLFQKTNTAGGTNISSTCTKGSANSICSNSDAKEYRFCSVVEYIGMGVGKVELCSIITNFKK